MNRLLEKPPAFTVTTTGFLQVIHQDVDHQPGQALRFDYIYGASSGVPAVRNDIREETKYTSLPHTHSDRVVVNSARLNESRRPLGRLAAKLRRTLA
jgi:hypothetical protein